MLSFKGSNGAVFDDDGKRLSLYTAYKMQLTYAFMNIVRNI